MKKRGFSLLEIIVVTAIMGIVMLIFSPMINAFIGAQDRISNQSKVDSRLNEVVEFIKRDVRNARSIGESDDEELEGEAVKIYNDDIAISNGIGNKIIIYTTDLEGNSKYIQYILEGEELKLKSSDTFEELSETSNKSVIILSNVEKCEFKYEDKILLFYFKINIPEKLKGKIRNEVRDVAITRINLE